MKRSFALTCGETESALMIAQAKEIFTARHVGILIDAILIRLRRFPIPYMIAVGEWLAERLGPRSARGTSRAFSSR